MVVELPITVGILIEGRLFNKIILRVNFKRLILVLLIYFRTLKTNIFRYRK